MYIFLNNTNQNSFHRLAVSFAYRYWSSKGSSEGKTPVIIPQAKFRAGVFRYEKSKWVSTLQNGGSTLVSSPYVVANEGSGLYEQIAEDEWFYQLGEGFADSNTIQIPPVEFRKNVELTGTYSCIEFQWKDIAGGTDILLNPTVFKQLKLVINGGYATSPLAFQAALVDATLAEFYNNGTTLF